MQQVKFVAPTQITRTLYHPDNYSFRKDKKSHRLQRLCLWVLKKLECHSPYQDTHFEYNTVTYEPYKIEQYIRQQWSEQYRLYNVTPKYLILGREQFYHLTKVIQDYPMKFNLFGGYNGYTPYNNEFMGMQIVVVPWMDGVLVVPDLDKML